MRLNRHCRNSARGFIALTSVLILTTMLLVLMSSTGGASYYARFDALNSEYKRISIGLSEACANAALLKVAQNYNYAPAPSGEVVRVGTDQCTIVAVGYSNPVYDALGNEIRKTMTATTSAKYPMQNGSWSTHKIVATVQNPTYAAAIPPTCSFSTNASTIHSGQSVTLSWATSGVATQFKIDRDIGGVVTTMYSNAGVAGTWADSPTESATYTATITGPGGSTQCQSPQGITVQLALAECADTLMILAGAMNTGDRADEGVAAKALLDIYKLAIPAPYVGVGSYGGLNGSAAQVPVSGQLTSSYGISAPASGLYATIDAITMTLNSSGGTDISAGISAASAEFTRANQPTHTKVLILVSPSGNHASDVQAAIAAASVAKLAAIQIFSINFGVGSSNDDWAKIATLSQNNVANGHDQAAADIENTDGDHFFISPTASAMKDIFQTIAQNVCPGAIPSPPPVPPPPAPPPPAPGEPLLIGSWNEIINVVP